MDCDFLRADQLLLPSNEKHRSFSTSTPFLHAPEHKLRSLSVSVCSTTENDSGLGASLSEFSVTSFANATGACPTITVSVCKTPTTCGEIPSFCGPHLDICVSPVSSKRFSIRRLESDFNSRKSFLARRSLDSDFSFSEGDDSFDECNRTLNTDESKASRALNISIPRKLDLDLNIYDSNEDVCTESSPYLSAQHESQLASKFDEILEKFSPVVSDRLIGRKMGREKVDILGELSDRSISCTSTILSFLTPQDLCRMCIVSRQWKSVCEADKLSNQRRRWFLRQHQEIYRKRGKENAGKRSVTPQTRAAAVPLQDLPVLQECVDTPCQDIVKTTTEQFMAVASSLKNDEKLQKCPRCRKPAKVLPVQDRGKCQNHDCNFDYCVKCLCEFHGSKECAPIVTKKTKTDAIGTRKSKKNLKRL
ncbi:F-box only protein 5-A-like [Mercenaria mercenaria]|uniref:F-box only protein 5-A-like n=1 Tax=Mercenaria mercenaria TaxID=6596 RepID=UPI00234EFEFD|nr:F-box only protein 5-A-like [Mercenaria mercenaria]